MFGMKQCSRLVTNLPQHVRQALFAVASATAQFNRPCNLRNAPARIR
jgi:hypothetical protein